MTFKNPEMKKILAKGGRRITLYTDEDLQKWLAKIDTTQKPSGASNEECYSLMALLWYTGARSSELIEFKKDDIYPLLDAKGLAVTMLTLKHGDSPRLISIPLNEITLTMYKYIQNSSPMSYYFHSFFSPKRSGRTFKTYETQRTVYKENAEGKEIAETRTTTHEKEYFLQNKKIYKFINDLTGLPPLYFRHHRFSWLARLGATTFQIRQFKGAKDDRSVAPYLQMGQESQKEYLQFFPKG